MRLRISLPALAALGAGVLVYTAGMAHALPWPPLASRSLAVIFLLVAITRLGGDSGLVMQRRLRWAVAGVALTAAVWFLVGSLFIADRSLTLLGLAHLLAVWLGAAPEPDAAERQRGWLILSATVTTISLLAIAALPVGARVPGQPALPLVVAVAIVFAATLIARGRMVGLALAALGGLVTFVIAGHVFADVLAHGAAFATTLGRAAPLLAGTAVLGAAPPLILFATRLPAVWRVLMPRGLDPVHTPGADTPGARRG